MRAFFSSRPLVLIAVWALYWPLAIADDLYQEYCSSENTGAEYPKFYWQWQSNGKCYTHCQGYALAIVQGYYCWCSNYVPAQQVSVSQCNLPCYGYPSEQCGSIQNRVYGYIAVDGKPSGTAGATGAAGPSRTTVQPSEATKSAITSKSVASANTPPSSFSTSISRAPSNSDSNSEPTTTPTASPSIQRITVSGAVITQYVTTSAPSAPSANTIPVQTDKGGGLSNGAVAGITIGVIAAVAIIAGLLFYFCFWLPRRRSREEEDVMPASSRTTSNKSPQRSSSFLNGVLGTNKPSMVRPLPRIHTGGFTGMEDDPSSNAQTISPMSQRRNSQPLFIDSRLNPNTLMSNPNTSHTSISTLQDDQDYSRPVLSVRNPDQH